MSEEKRERMRKIIEELKQTIRVGTISQEGVICREAMLECLNLNWVTLDESGNFVPTDLGKAMVGRTGGET